MWIFKNRYFQFFLVLGLIVYLLIEAKGEGDLFIYSYAAVNLGNGANIYQANYMGGYHYYYSVLFAYFLNLFSGLPFYGVKFCWLLLNATLFFHLLYLLKQSKWVMVLSENQRDYFLLFVFIFSFRFFHQNIHAAQITIIVLWCCIYSIVSIDKGKLIQGALILALGINLKLLPIVFLPYLIYRGYFKAFFLCILFYVTSLYLPSLLIDHDYNVSLLKSWYALINPSNTEHVLDTDERSFHGLSTLLATLFVAHPPDPLAMSLKRNIADLPLDTLKYILLFSRLLLVSLTLYFLKWPPFKKSKNKIQTVFEVSYILLLIPLIFPHQQHYAFLFSVPAFACCLYYLFLHFTEIGNRKRKFLIVFLILIYLTANLSALIGEFNRYYEHYKIITYGALLLIPLLMYVSSSINTIKLRVSE